MIYLGIVILTMSVFHAVKEVSLMSTLLFNSVVVGVVFFGGVCINIMVERLVCMLSVDVLGK